MEILLFYSLVDWFGILEKKTSKVLDTMFLACEFLKYFYSVLNPVYKLQQKLMWCFSLSIITYYNFCLTL